MGQPLQEHLAGPCHGTISGKEKGPRDSVKLKQPLEEKRALIQIWQETLGPSTYILELKLTIQEHLGCPCQELLSSCL